jgi:hypothetical protein
MMQYNQHRWRKSQGRECATSQGWKGVVEGGEEHPRGEGTRLRVAGSLQEACWGIEEGSRPHREFSMGERQSRENGFGGSTHVIESVVGPSVPHTGECPPPIYLAGNYSIEFDGRRTPTRSRGAARRPVLRRSRDRAVGTLPGIAARIPLLSPITNYWSDVWVIDELVCR